MLYDVIIIGSGPAGLSAAIYAERAKLKTLVLEKAPMSGGQILNTYEVDNYPGIPGVGGFDLGSKFRAHADAVGCQFVTAEVLEIKNEADHKVIVTDKETYQTKTIVLASGATHRTLGVPGEEELMGMGVSYCATCDGIFFKDKEVFVIGGGYAAAQESVFLTRYASHVTIIMREKEFTCPEKVSAKAKQNEKISILYNTKVLEVRGDEEMIKSITYCNDLTGEKTTFAPDNERFGVFIFAGYEPVTEFVRDIIKLNDKDYIVTDCAKKTSIDGVYAAGDVCEKNLRQVVTAVGDGAAASTEMERYISEIKKRKL